MKQLSHLIHMYSSLGDVRVAGQAGAAAGAAWQPSVDIYECPDGLVIVAELPGVDKAQIGVVFERGTLLITGVRHKCLPEHTQYVHQLEIPYGPFARRIPLPGNVNAERIAAEYQDGYLTISIPREDANER